MPLRSKRRMVFTAIFSITLSVSGALRSAEVPADLTIDPEARRAIDDCGMYYKSLKAFQVSIESHGSVEAGGKKSIQISTLTVSAQRPNKLAFLFDTSNEESTTRLTFSCDGVSLSGASVMTEGARSTSMYATDKSPDSWEGIIRNRFANLSMGMATLAPVPSALLRNEPALMILAKQTNVKFEGREVLDGIECHVVHSISDASTRNAGSDFDWRLWIEASDRPLVRQVQVMSGAIASKFVKLNIVSTFKDWQLNPSLAESTFAFARPKEPAELRPFEELFSGKPSAKKVEPPEIHELVGRQAPPFKLDLLDGGTIDLPALKDENVVILDFWSTSCVACIQALPIVERVAQEFKSKGVRLLAVNVGQTAEEAREFLNNVKWSGKAPIPLDQSEAVAKDYGVTQMPHMVLIGKDRLVHAVRIGKSKDFDARLRSDIDSLLSGKNLAAEELAAAKKRTAKSTRVE
jgi:thiol-disulfide isomerase/thioredoxin